MRNTLKKMAELTYAKLTQGGESTRLPHAQINVIEKKSFLVRKVPLPGSQMSRYPGCLLPWFTQDIKQVFAIISICLLRKASEI